MRHSKPLLGEFELIEAIRQRFARILGRGVTLGIGDDCAVLSPAPGHELLVSTDLLIEGRHFRRDLHSAASAGHRCLARGLSDLAAMGATPLAAFLSLALPAHALADKAGRRWLDGFLGGLEALARSAAVPLAGGDTGQLPGDMLVADIVVVGQTPRGKAMLRSGARAGDALYVTGTLGGAAAELERMTAGAPKLPRSRSPQSFPQPRLAAGVALRALGVRAAIDLSDGLSSDLPHLARASEVRAIVDTDALPLAPLLLRGRTRDEALPLALHGGEDYELLFSAPRRLAIPDQVSGIRVTRIGELRRASSKEPLVMQRHADGREHELLPGGWEHFTRRGESASK